MDIHKYIESCTKIDADQRSVDEVTWFPVPTNEKVNLASNNSLPYHLEIEKDFYEHSNMENLLEAEYQSDDDTTSEWRYRFAEIRTNVREIGLGWNISNNILEERYRESQQRYAENNLDESISESNYSYTTANSVITDDSYSTAIEDFEYLRRPSLDMKSDISIDSSIDKGRYKKNALITGLLQSAENSLSNDDQVFTDYSTNERDTSNLLNDVCNEKKNEHENKSNKKLDGNDNEKTMYENKGFSLFQSKEDEDVYVHPLREQIQEDPVWQKFRLSRKGIEHIETARQYYMSLAEDQFALVEQVESKPKRKSRRKTIRNKYTFHE